MKTLRIVVKIKSRFSEASHFKSVTLNATMDFLAKTIEWLNENFGTIAENNGLNDRFRFYTLFEGKFNKIPNAEIVKIMNFCNFD